MSLEIIKERNVYGWVTAVIDGRWVQAQVHNNPSDLCVNKGKISNLSIGKHRFFKPQKEFDGQMVYKFERGLKFDKLNTQELVTIVGQLEMLSDGQ